MKSDRLAKTESEAGQNLMAYQPICPILETYYRQDPRAKIPQLKTRAAKHLFSGLPLDVANVLRDGFLSGEFGENIPDWEKVVNHFQASSEIIPALTKNPGTFAMLERMYHFLPVKGVIDEYFLMCLSGGQALKSRYDAVNNFSVSLVSHILEGQDSCWMVDIGSGPGRNGIDITKRNPEFRNRLRVECIEIDSDAIEKGEELIRENGLNNIAFVKQSMTKLNGYYNGKVDFGLSIGVVCGLPFDTRVQLLKSQLPWFRRGGKLVVAGLTERMAKMDLLCAYILRETTGWCLQFRPEGDLRRAAIEAGWKPSEMFTEQPTRFYDIEVLEA